MNEIVEVSTEEPPGGDKPPSWNSRGTYRVLFGSVSRQGQLLNRGWSLLNLYSTLDCKHVGLLGADAKG